MAGSVDCKAPFSCRAAVAQPAQPEHFAVGQDAVDVGEAAAVARVVSGSAAANVREHARSAGGARRLSSSPGWSASAYRGPTLGCGVGGHGVSRPAMRAGAEDNGWMAMSSPFIIALTALDESVLRARARSSTSAHRDVLRARIVLAAADGATNTEIAAEVGVHVDTVRKWRRRFVAGWPARARRPASQRAASGVHPGAGGRGQGAGLHPARRDRCAVVAVVER